MSLTTLPSRRATVLIVEDDPALLSLYKSALMLAGFTVLTAADGIEALLCIEHASLDVIVLDIGLPRLSGLDVYQEVVANAGTHDLPIVVVTGQADVDLAGFTCVLRKPVDPDALVRSVEDQLRTSQL